MRKRVAHGLAIVLTIVSLGAAQGPNRSESGQSRTAKLKLAVSGSQKKNHRLKPYQVGTASWYGSDFEGRTTASGEPFHMYDLTAAHPTLPIGTYVRVTNLRNGRAVVVRINDRGPIIPGRIIDVSYGTARALNFKSRGLQRVRLDVVQPQPVLMARALAQ